MNYFRFIWRWSWLLTLPIVCFMLFWGWNTLQRFYTFEVQHQVAKQGRVFSIWRVGKMEFDHLLRRAELALAVNPNSSQQTQFRTIDLFIPEANLASLNSDLPNSGFNYVKGGFWYDGKVRKVSIKYRGDTNYHWAYYKKSLRIKTKKSRLFEGMRAFNLIAPRTPEILNNHLSFMLGKQMGLISPRTELVNVNINGKYTGLYILTEQLSESTLREHEVMPGDLYSGELIAKDSYSHLNYFKGSTNTLFTNAEFWGKTAVNNHFPEQSHAPLQRLLEIINMPDSEQKHEALSGILDMPAFGQFHALELLTASLHVDEVHNWRLYYDPYRSKFVPVVWDLVGWQHLMVLPHFEATRMDNITSSLHYALHSNGDFIRARHVALEDFFRANSDQKFLTDLDSMIEDVAQTIQHDPNLVGQMVLLSPGEVVNAMTRLRGIIKRVFADIRKTYLEDDTAVAYHYDSTKSVLELSIDGRQPVNKLRMEFSQSPQNLTKVELRYWQNKRVKIFDVTSFVHQKGNQIELDFPLLARFKPRFLSNLSAKTMVNSLKILPAYYQLKFFGIDSANTLIELTTNRGGGVFGSAKYAQQVKPNSFDTFYLSVPVIRPADPVIWQGDINLSGINRITSPLIIRPGTTVRLAPKTSVILSNKLLAIGSSEKPIRFVPMDDSQAAWGSIVLQGEGANGSRISHAEFVGGSGNKGELFEYTAMLSVHDVKDVHITHSVFRDNRDTDDMVHTVYSQITFTDTLFKNSLFDSLDIDISEARIERCEFINSGNDAIDMMTSRAIVSDTVIENSRDKAVSVGEKSYLLAINNQIKNSEVGIQTKDGSVAALYNMDFINNRHALDAYKKNWRYDDGGTTYVYKSRFTNNRDTMTADKKSIIRVYDSYLDQSIEKSKNRIKLDESVDSIDQRMTNNTELYRDAKEMALMEDFNSSFMSLVRVNRRGFSKIARH